MKRPTCLTCGGVLRSPEERKSRRCWLCELMMQLRVNGKEAPQR